MCQGDAPQLDELPKVRRLMERGLVSEFEAQRLTNVPVDMRLLHAGPLQVEPWEEGKPWRMSAWALQQNGWTEQPETR